MVFTIDKTRKVVNAKTRGSHPVLEQEATEIIASLPRMSPEKQWEIPIGVRDSVPITFEVLE